MLTTMDGLKTASGYLKSFLDETEFHAGAIDGAEDPNPSGYAIGCIFVWQISQKSFCFKQDENRGIE